MNKPISSTSCQSGCWILAAVSGVVVLAVCLFLIELGILASIFMGAVVFIVVGLFVFLLAHWAIGARKRGHHECLSA